LKKYEFKQVVKQAKLEKNKLELKKAENAYEQYRINKLKERKEKLEKDKNYYKPKNVTIQQKERVIKAAIKKAINGVFQDITIEDDFNYVKTGKEIGIEIFSKDNNNVKNGEPNFNIGQLNLINTIQTQLNQLYLNNTQYSLLSNIVIKFQIYHIDPDERDDDGRIIVEYKDAYYNSKVSEKLTSINKINQWSEYEVAKFDKHLDEYTNNGSGWIFDKIISLKIQVAKTKKRTAGTYIETPKILANKKAVRNIKNKDDRCIDWCLTAFFFKNKINNKDTSNVKYYEKYIDQIKIPKDQSYPIEL
jgi:hypothetical protein